MSKVYGYCRTALAGNIEEQVELVSNYCKANGLDLSVCFCDDGVSGHEMHKEELEKLLDVIEKGDVIVTKDFSRFMRNPIVQQGFVDGLNSRGIEVMYVDEKEEDDKTFDTWFEDRLAELVRGE